MLGNYYCLDNDIILKLATCSLFQKTLSTLEVDSSQVKILDTARYKIQGLNRRIGRTINHKYNTQQALSDINYCSKLSQGDVNQDRFIKLQGVEGIDAGEAILISHVSYHNQLGYSSYLLTGDKRCLRALANSQITGVIKDLNDRVWCLEQLILKNIEVYGFDFVKSKVIPVKECDTALKTVFGSGQQATLERSRDTLKSYIQDLRLDTGNLLNPYPE